GPGSAAEDGRAAQPRVARSPSASYGLRRSRERHEQHSGLGKPHSEGACGGWAHFTVDHEPARSLEGYHRRVGARAEVTVAGTGVQPLFSQLLLDLPHRRPDHVGFGPPLYDDPRLCYLLVSSRRCAVDLGAETAY